MSNSYKEYASKEYVDTKMLQVVTATLDNQANYIATVDGITELTSGLSFIIIPNAITTFANATLNVNNLGAKPLMLHGTSTISPKVEVGPLCFNWANHPYRVIYDNDSWVLTDVVYLDTLSVSKGGTGQTSIADTTYTTARYRASALVATETDPTVNGVINWTYE